MYRFPGGGDGGEHGGIGFFAVLQEGEPGTPEKSGGDYPVGKIAQGFQMARFRRQFVYRGMTIFP